MATTTKNGLDVDAFREVLAGIDLKNPAKTELAIRKGVLICAESGLSFGDACAEAYGQDDSTAELERENATLRAEVERRKQGGDELADALTKAQKEIAALQGCGESGGRVWSTKNLLLALAGVIVLRIGLYMALGEKLPVVEPSWSPAATASPGFGPWFANMVLVLSGAWLLAQWHRAQHLADGRGQLVMKWLVLAPGLFLASLMFFAGAPWEPSVFHRAPVPALVASVLTVLLVMSKFTERVAERVPEALGSFSLRGSLLWVKGWFL
ncbi:MAG: hypothetical protein ACLPWF_30005 [Bryobacteraceae bacterium]